MSTNKIPGMGKYNFKRNKINYIWIDLKLLVNWEKNVYHTYVKIIYIFFKSTQNNIQYCSANYIFFQCTYRGKIRRLVELGTRLGTELWGIMRKTPGKSHQKSGIRSGQRRLSRRE